MGSVLALHASKWLILSNSFPHEYALVFNISVYVFVYGGAGRNSRLLFRPWSVDIYKDRVYRLELKLPVR